MIKTLTVLLVLAGFSLLAWNAPASSSVVGREADYSAGGVTMKGYLAYDKSFKGRRPGVLIVPEWWGLGGYEQKRARMLAQLGYVAMAVDMYGDGTQAKDSDEASKLSSEVAKDLDLEKARFVAALDFLRKQPEVDGSRIAAIGYCFGGGVVLNMAVHGISLEGAASFHGSLGTVRPEGSGVINAKILVLHGADDKLVGPEEVQAFRQEMEKAGADFHIILYPGAGHGFTNPAADQYAKKFHLPVAYDAKADRESWQELKKFLRRLFEEPGRRGEK